MISHRSSAVLLLAVVALAGCGAPFSADAGSPSPGATSPTDSPPAVEPPGISDGSLEDVDALLEAHVAALRASGYRLETTVAGSRMDYVATANFSSFRVAPGPDASNPAIWANETLTLARLDRDGETVYQRPPRFWAGPDRLTGAERLRSLFDAGTFVRNGTAPCGDRTCAVLTASDSPRFHDFTAEALVDGSGVVHQFEATYTRSDGDGITTAEARVTLTQLGDVTVERPSWVDTAIDRTA